MKLIKKIKNKTTHIKLCNLKQPHPICKSRTSKFIIKSMYNCEGAGLQLSLSSTWDNTTFPKLNLFKQREFKL